MGTRSLICMKTDNGYEGIYCHWDGYLEHNGKILAAHYHTTEDVKKLIAGGDMSSLSETIEECELYNDREGEEWEDIKPFTRRTKYLFNLYAQRSACDFIYLFEDGEWFYTNRRPQYFGLSDGSPFSAFKPLPKPLENTPEMS